jgi:hypothetical protein
VYKPVTGKFTRIYGGEKISDTDFPAKTKIDIALLEGGQQVEVNESFLAYVARGKGFANTEQVEEGDLIRGDAIKFEAIGDVLLVIIHID